MAATNKKMTVRKILVPTDFSELSLQALEYAAQIARSDNGDILLFHVFEATSQNSLLDMRVDFVDIIERGVKDKFREIIASNKKLSGVNIHPHVTIGNIAQEIDNIAAAENIKLIVMGTHGVSGRTNIGKYILGSNAYRTIQNAPCPIITIREKPLHNNIRNIVVPLDSTIESTAKMDVAIRWAKFFKAKIHLLAVTAFWEEFRIDVKEISAKVKEVETKLIKEGVAYTSRIIRHQAPSESVLDYSYKNYADMIVIVTGQEARWNEMFFGSSARNIISESRVPVLSVNIRQYDVAQE